MTPKDKKDIKEIFIESLEPFANAIKGDFDRVDKRFGEIKDEIRDVKTDVSVIKVDLQDVKKKVYQMEKNSSAIFIKIDKYIKLYEDTKQEFSIMRKDIDKIKDVLREKLRVEIE